jgi:hypothetical protein
MSDELAAAITRFIAPMLRRAGFRRVRRRVFVRSQNGIAQRLGFQVDGWGSREFCVNVSANLIAANELVTLQPGFRLTRDIDGGDLWLPSKTKYEAETSARVIVGSILAEAFPFFEATATIGGLSELLAKEEWGSDHHQQFQLGVAAAFKGDFGDAQRHLSDAIVLYRNDGRDWCDDYIDRANRLCEALADGEAMQLLHCWEQANRKAHGVIREV